MSRGHESLKRRLEAYHEDARPPAELLARLKADVPRELPAPANAGSTTPRARWRGQAWKLAAAVVLLVGAGFLTARLLPDVEPPAERATSAAEEREPEAERLEAADEVMQEARQEAVGGAGRAPAEPAPVPAPRATPEQAAPPAAQKRIEARPVPRAPVELRQREELRGQAEADAAFDVPEAAMETVPPPPPPAAAAPRPTQERLAVPPPSPPPPEASGSLQEELEERRAVPEERWETLQGRAEELLVGGQESEPGELGRLLRELEALLTEHWPHDADKAELVARVARAAGDETE